MNKKQLFIIWVMVLFISLTSTLVYAEYIHHIDIFYEDCMNESKCITSEMVKCGEETYQKWEVELDKYYNLLMDVLDDDSKKQLRHSQEEWIEFKDAEFAFIPYYFLDIGSYIGPATIDNKISIIRARALQLKAYYDILDLEEVNYDEYSSLPFYQSVILTIIIFFVFVVVGVHVSKKLSRSIEKSRSDCYNRNLRK